MGYSEPVEMGVKLSGSVASMLNVSRLVEMLHSCLCMQCSAWNTDIIPTEWKRGLVVPFGKERMINRTATTTDG